MVTGGVKTGKSTLSVWLVRSQLRSRRFKTRFMNFFRKIFNRQLKPIPQLYSNVPLNLDYIPLTDDLLLRKKRFVYNSVIYIQEASLVADSQYIRDMDVNDRLLLFNKLIAHETKGGMIVYDTQSPSDLHYTIKRSLSNYYYIHSLIKWIPFFLVAKVQECRYSDENSVVLENDEDLEDKTRLVIFPKRTWKFFDCYCYSAMTDNLPVEERVVNGKDLKDLKAREILSFRNRKIEEVKNVEKKND